MTDEEFRTALLVWAAEQRAETEDRRRLRRRAPPIVTEAAGYSRPTRPRR